ncbi:hypothetical protein H0S70_07285 [Chryseobacterium manosquense]|uniref:Uncharacterized protein n=1 Tax=Chryseobacterium manosquense TaxID=2754694 RepID=A0A7H1DTA0_9FLAO|nr:hypothetical protein [Chryseobacterium manosquense]QNS40208.1 hypothetical protein H0S70_07285 [Chryseobacterium manosquense]
MNNADKPINPCLMQQVGDNEFRANKPNDPKEWNVPTAGLTKREYFAGIAMQGLLASFTEKASNGMWGTEVKETVKSAVDYADELLKQLEATEIN